LKGDVCVAEEKVAPAHAPATASRKNSDEEDARARRKQQATRDREPDQPRRQQKQASQPEPRAPRQQALARPSITSGGGGGGGGGSHTMIGVGF
jgi:Ni/Co efflux regulator RcnB